MAENWKEKQAWELFDSYVEKGWQYNPENGNIMAPVDSDANMMEGTSYSHIRDSYHAWLIGSASTKHKVSFTPEKEFYTSILRLEAFYGGKFVKPSINSPLCNKKSKTIQEKKKNLKEKIQKRHPEMKGVFRED